MVIVENEVLGMNMANPSGKAIFHIPAAFGTLRGAEINVTMMDCPEVSGLTAGTDYS